MKCIAIILGVVGMIFILFLLFRKTLKGVEFDADEEIYINTTVGTKQKEKNN